MKFKLRIVPLFYVVLVATNLLAAHHYYFDASFGGKKI